MITNKLPVPIVADPNCPKDTVFLLPPKDASDAFVWHGATYGQLAVSAPGYNATVAFDRDVTWQDVHALCGNIYAKWIECSRETCIAPDGSYHSYGLEFEWGDGLRLSLTLQINFRWSDIVQKNLPFEIEVLQYDNEDSVDAAFIHSDCDKAYSLLKDVDSWLEQRLRQAKWAWTEVK